MIDIVAVLLLNVVLNGWLVYQWFQETRGFWSAAIHTTRRAICRDVPLGTPADRDHSAGDRIWIAYEVPFIANGGQTLGKRIMGIRVVPRQCIGSGTAVPCGAGTPLGLPMVFWLISLIFILISPIFQLMDCLSPTLGHCTWHCMIVRPERSWSRPPSATATARR